MHDLTEADRDELLAHAHYRCVCGVAEFARGKDHDDDLPGILQEYFELSGEPFFRDNYDWARPEYADVCLAKLAWSSLRQAGLHVELLSPVPEALTAHVRGFEASPIEGRIKNALPAWLGVKVASCYEAGNCAWLVRLERISLQSN